MNPCPNGVKSKAKPSSWNESESEVSVPSSNPILNAAALQDHLTRQYSLHLHLPGTKSRVQGSRKKGQGIKSKSQPSSNISSVGNKGCSSCGLTSSNIRSKTSKQAKSHRTSDKIETEEEYVLDKAPPSYTLAQRLGLVGAPPRLLNEHSWKGIKESSNTRHDSSLPCPICQEPFNNLSTQVLLSCSHVFHLNCLKSFERFSKKKCCPLCRTDNYQKRVIFEGANVWRHRAATIIQSQWRGYLSRKWYKTYRAQVPPTHPDLRMKHFEKKLSSLTEMMVESCDKGNTQAETMIAQSDANMTAIRDAIQLYELYSRPIEVDWDMLCSKSQGLLSSDCSVCLGPLLRQSDQPYQSGLSGLALYPIGLPSKTNSSSTDSEGHGSMNTTADSIEMELTVGRTASQITSLSLLSCGHFLHVVCIEALERFASEGTLPLCPLCRAPYQRIGIGHKLE